jgi:hypothetical protein
LRQTLGWVLVLGALSCGGSSSESSGLVSGICTYIAPATSEGPPQASLCYTYTNAPALAISGGSGLCPQQLSTVTVATVTVCPATLGNPPVAQLGTCTVNVPALGSAAYSYTILYYAGADYPTCHAAAQGCADQHILAGYTSSWAGIGGCN